MWEARKRFAERGVAVVVVTFESGYFAKVYAEETGISWPIVVDADRELYEHYKMLRASFWELWGPQTWYLYAKLLLKGRKLQHAGGDIRQRGGNVLVDADGIVRLHHIGSGPADRPPVEAIIDAVVDTRHRPAAELAN